MSTLGTKIQDVFNEPACDKNQGKSEKERKKGCTKQLTPGAAAGGYTARLFPAGSDAVAAITPAWINWQSIVW